MRTLRVARRDLVAIEKPIATYYVAIDTYAAAPERHTKYLDDRPQLAQKGGDGPQPLPNPNAIPNIKVAIGWLRRYF
jgi:hypothetical protein